MVKVCFYIILILHGNIRRALFLSFVYFSGMLCLLHTVCAGKIGSKNSIYFCIFALLVTNKQFNQCLFA